MMKKILIIEDDVLISNLERDYLEAENLEVAVANDGYEGLIKIKDSEPDLIILDLMLPHLDGFELCKKIREEMNIPVIIVSAKKTDPDKIKGLGLGANDYIVKPFSPSELVARVKSQLRYYESITQSSTPISEAQSITIGNLRIEPLYRKAYINDQEIELVNKEYELLEFLAGSPNIVYSRDSLFDKVWGMDAIGDTSTVTVHIKRLRDKMKEIDSNTSLIETVFGVGYRFSPK